MNGPCPQAAPSDLAVHRIISSALYYNYCINSTIGIQPNYVGLREDSTPSPSRASPYHACQDGQSGQQCFRCPNCSTLFSAQTANTGTTPTPLPPSGPPTTMTFSPVHPLSPYSEPVMPNFPYIMQNQRSSTPKSSQAPSLASTPISFLATPLYSPRFKKSPVSSAQ